MHSQQRILKHTDWGRMSARLNWLRLAAKSSFWELQPSLPDVVRDGFHRREEAVQTQMHARKRHMGLGWCSPGVNVVEWYQQSNGEQRLRPPPEMRMELEWRQLRLAKMQYKRVRICTPKPVLTRAYAATSGDCELRVSHNQVAEQHPYAGLLPAEALRFQRVAATTVLHLCYEMS
eukprot:2208004-Rhodomonas_salina.1